MTGPVCDCSVHPVTHRTFAGQIADGQVAHKEPVGLLEAEVKVGRIVLLPKPCYLRVSWMHLEASMLVLPIRYCLAADGATLLTGARLAAQPQKQQRVFPFHPNGQSLYSDDDNLVRCLAGFNSCSPPSVSPGLRHNPLPLQRAVIANCGDNWCGSVSRRMGGCPMWKVAVVFQCRCEELWHGLALAFACFFVYKTESFDVVKQLDAAGDNTCRAEPSAAIRQSGASIGRFRRWAQAMPPNGLVETVSRGCRVVRLEHGVGAKVGRKVSRWKGKTNRVFGMSKCQA